MIYLAQQYHLVTGDEFQLFYRSIIRSVNPYQYHIAVTCAKGKPFPRYFTFTPKQEDVGEYELKIQVISDQGIVDEASTTLIVKERTAPKKDVTILCVGDSLTKGGFWTAEGYRRYTEGEEFTNKINLIGTCEKMFDDEVIKYEGYGGWQWRSFCNPVKKTDVWVKAKHQKTETDQHSVWINNNERWILETIEKDKLKFKRSLEENTNQTDNIKGVFKCEKNAHNSDDIEIEEYYFEDENPFINPNTNQLDFKYYLDKNNFAYPDYIYILLTWNGLGNQYATTFETHEKYANILINEFHNVVPNAKIVCLGIPPCSINGGIASNYGASGPYSDYYGTFTTALNYNKWLEHFLQQPQFNTFCSFEDVAGQFDVENNMPTMELPVNTRNKKLETVGNNGVHPALSGYLQIGDVFFRSLVHKL